jgi:hypothetical protein
MLRPKEVEHIFEEITKLCSLWNILKVIKPELKIIKLVGHVAWIIGNIQRKKPIKRSGLECDIALGNRLMIMCRFRGW